MKKLMFIALPLFIGCSSELFSALTGIFVSPRVYSNYYNCSQYIDRYNALQDEKKNLDVEYEKVEKMILYQMNKNKTMKIEF